MKKKELQREFRRNIRPFFYACIVLGLLVITSKVVHSVLTTHKGFLIKNVVVNRRPDIKELIQNSLRPNMNLFSLNCAPLQKSILRQFPEMKSVVFRKKYPSTLEVEIIERLPFFQIRGGKVYIFDREGVAIKGPFKSPVGNIIFVNGLSLRQEPVLGQKIQDRNIERVIFLLKIFEQLKLAESIQMLRIDDYYTVEFFLQGVKIIFSFEKAEEKLTLFAQMLLPKFSKEWGTIAYLDLRFKDYIVHYKGE